MTPSVFRAVSLCWACSSASGIVLKNNIARASFDSSGRLTNLADLTSKDSSAYDFKGDGWVFELGDLPFPKGATVRNNSQVLTNSSCPNLPSPKTMTTIDQCAFKCMTTDGCEAFTANYRPTTWGRPRVGCRLSTCPGPFKDVQPDAYESAGLKPKPPGVLHLTAGTCGQAAVTQATASTLEVFYNDCQGFMVNVTYELAQDWHFVTKHLAVCKRAGKSLKCDPKAGFTVRHVNVWPGVAIDNNKTELGAMGMNVFARKQEYGNSWPPGSSETASFWRTSGSQVGLFTSVQTSFSESGEGFGAFRWGGDKSRWGSINYGAWQSGAAFQSRDVVPAASQDTLNVMAKSAKFASDAALMLEKAAKPGEDTSVAVTLLEGIHGWDGSKRVPKPQDGAYAGVLFNAVATPASLANAATLDGFAAVVCLGSKQTARLLRLSGPLGSDSPDVLAEAPINVSSVDPVRLSLNVVSGKATVTIDGSKVLEKTLPSVDSASGVGGGGVGLLVLQQDTSFYNFDASVQKAGTPLRRSESLLQGSYSPMMKQVPSLGPWHQADSGVLGFTRLSGHELPESGLDLGEQAAFTQCVEHFLMDKEMRKNGAVRYQVAWDSNEYQLDMARAKDREEYKRLIRRNAELGIKFQVFEPRNTAVSSRWDHTDAWWWEEVLWFQLGIGIRNGSWAPKRDALPATVKEMMDFFKEQGVSPAAYAYPTLAWRGDGDDEWLYESPNRENGDLGKRASLASPKLQDYLIETMNTFLKVTGGAGFAWDYGIQGDTRTATLYEEVRGWLRILAAIRKAKPDMVMDHRQIAHNFGPWYHLAGSYSEPIGGDENPESYGAALASLSTDHILADHLRLTNYRYRLQLLPNDRVPGFMFHQTERHFNNGTGEDSAGKPGDKVDSNGNALWKPDKYPDPNTGNYSGVTYSNCVMAKDWHTRDFDYLGYRYSLLSTLGTAGRNLVVANVPARDLEEYNAFPKGDIAWIRKWFDWADANGEQLRRTMPLVGYEWPRLGHVDGTVAVTKGAGFIFLYNPSPDTVPATLTLDETLSLRDAGGRWLISEIYPRENGVPLGIWKWGDLVSFDVGGGSARILQMVPWTPEREAKPIAFNMSYSSIENSVDGGVSISGASGLTGSSESIVVRLATGSTSTGISINGQSHKGKTEKCQSPVAPGSCVRLSVSFAGSASLRHNSLAAPAPKVSNDWQTATITVTSAMLAQLQQRQDDYNISWIKEDLDASWLAPSRLLLYPYVTRPTPTLAVPSVLIDGKPAKVVKQYNSRGNHAIVPAGGGAASGLTARTFLGWYIDCSDIKPDVSHSISIHFPWTSAQREEHPFLGLFWHNIEDAFTSELVKQSAAAIFI